METSSGKVALVTGASGGLGSAIASLLEAAGINVVVTDLLVERKDQDQTALGKSPSAGHSMDRNCVSTDPTVSEVRTTETKSLTLEMDVRNPQNISEVFRRVEQDLGTVDILVNNAGLMDNFGLMQVQNPLRWEEHLRVNLTGAFLCSKAAWTGMVKSSWGRIINISSIAGLMGAFGQPSYGASKAGLIGLTRSLALEGATAGITVNAVCPGLIHTDAIKSHKPEFLDRMKNRTAMRRLGTPEEVAAVVLFLASAAASYVTGAAIPVTGGADLYTF
ncbi:MAG: SDR family oxidoreductase [Desulfomonilaceae bacterium]|nr:SDR family oxidoreductase [Desulfomonilaceae bacterium]